MKTLSSLVFFLSSITGFSQGDTIFFNAQWVVCEKIDVEYFRITEKTENGFVVKDMYWKSCSPQMIANCKSWNPVVKNGPCTYYFPSGKKDTEGNYVDDKKIGTWIEWTKDGKDSTITQYLKNGTLTKIRESKTVEKENTDAIMLIESLPEYPGGQAAMSEFLKKNIEYPKYARDHGITGKCFVNFVIDIDGSVTDVRVQKGVEGCVPCDEAAVRVVKMMPAWTAGKQNGKYVKVQYTLPISFTLPTYYKPK